MRINTAFDGFVILLTILGVGPIAAAEPSFAKHDAFTHGTDGYHTYRIPGLVCTPKGTLLLFCDGRVNGAGDIGKMDLLLRRSLDDGRTWQPMQVLFTDPGKDTKIGNVSAVVDEKTGTVHALYCKDLTRAYCLTSTDEGKTFQPAVKITDTLKQFPFQWKYFAMGHAHGIQLKSGRLLVPVFLSGKDRTGAERKEAPDFRVGVLYSDDSGAHWNAGGLVPEDSRVNESTLYERADGSVVVNSRSVSRSLRVESRSTDAGATWSKIEGIAELAVPVCQASTIVARDPAGKRVVLFSSPTGKTRADLTIRLSRDDGKTWPLAKLVGAGPGAYGDLARGPDGTIYLAYENGVKGAYEKISVARFNIEWLLEKNAAAPVAPMASSATAPKWTGVLVDDDQAVLTGMWEPSRTQTPLVGRGYRHDGAADRGKKSARFTPDLSAAGEYEVRLLYPITSKSATDVSVTIVSAAGEKTVTVNQRKSPTENGIARALGVFRFESGKKGSVLVSNDVKEGFVLIDAVQFVPLDVAKAERSESPKEPAPTPQAKVIDFRKVGDVTLRLHLYAPPEHKPTDSRPAILFFFGGGWDHGELSQFARHAAHFASRGLVAICPEYRTREKHGATPFECIADGKAAMRWVRSHAVELGVDPKRIAAGGGSAGGHVALATAVLTDLEEDGASTSVSAVPDALVLFNPVVDTTKTGYGAAKLGARSQEASPVHHLRSGLPPTILFHGKSDTTVPFENAERFTTEMKKHGNTCNLIGFDGMRHGFYWKKPDFAATLRAADNFLVERGWLTSEPTMAPSTPAGRPATGGTP